MYLQHCDRFAKCMCVGRRSRCALPANGVYRELQCATHFVMYKMGEQLKQINKHIDITVEEVKFVDMYKHATYKPFGF